MQIQELLTSLGSSPEEIAESLRRNGIQGVRNTARMLNPIVRYIQAAVKIDYRGMDLIKPGVLRIHMPDGAKADVLVPTSVMDFLDAFHHAKFPDLERQTSLKR